MEGWVCKRTSGRLWVQEDTVGRSGDLNLIRPEKHDCGSQGLDCILRWLIIFLPIHFNLTSVVIQEWETVHPKRVRRF